MTRSKARYILAVVPRDSLFSQPGLLTKPVGSFRVTLQGWSYRSREALEVRNTPWRGANGAVLVYTFCMRAHIYKNSILTNGSIQRRLSTWNSSHFSFYYPSLVAENTKAFMVLHRLSYVPRFKKNTDCSITMACPT